MIHNKYFEMKEKQDVLIYRLNEIDQTYENGIYDRYQNPVLTRAHVPIHWRYDLDIKNNPNFLERLGVNATLNPGAIYFEGEFYLVVRMEGLDRKSVFALAKSKTGIDGFEFTNYLLEWDDIDEAETNVYDMRLTKHEDGYIYGVYCSESKDPNAPEGDTSMAIAKAGILRTKDMKSWQRLPNLMTESAQQRNVVLHPEFVDGQYALYTRPQDGFISTGSGGGIGFALLDSMELPRVDVEKVIDPKVYHTIYELKNGQGPAPIKTDKGWIHIAHGVRNTAAGLRYVLYTFATDLDDVTSVIAKPGGHFLAPYGKERIGDVSNVVFCNGALEVDGLVYIYYASSDTRIHVATTSLEKLMDYTFNTPEDKFRSLDCAKQRNGMIDNNLKIMSENL